MSRDQDAPPKNIPTQEQRLGRSTQEQNDPHAPPGVMKKDAPGDPTDHDPKHRMGQFGSQGEHARDTGKGRRGT